MQLYDNPASPFCRKVRVVLIETGQIDAVEVLPAAGTALDPGQMPLAENPLGKIPVLTRPEGPALHDSRVICRYLDARAGGGLYPESRLWEVLTLEATADGIMDAAVLMVYETRCRPEAERSAPWVEGQWDRVTRALDAIEARWISQLAGPLTMGQIALGCALGYLDFRHGACDWRQGRESLAAWEAGIARRPAMEQTAPGG
ncbi:glutathione S-transferase [Rhodovulum tesquicola]|uniref:glutathione S-transferase n=1 Tax=Rhodovulum tesquicola TaxID=540254 RepID=UPI002097CCC4|nr:glutathione S-transferase [Rhodovulum tesquicola]MCO8144725.1 glutathione S-transferase [Rhodovulum tesquicola]